MRFSSPALIFMAVVMAAPSIFSLILSLTNWQGFGTEMSWVGLQNYESLWQSDVFRTALVNTFILAFVGGALIFIIVFFSLMGLRHMRGAEFARAVVFVPIIISPVAIGVALGFLLNPAGGVNQLLEFLSLEGLRHSWLAPDNIFKMVVLGTVWSVSGYYLAIVATGVDAIPEHLYEEAYLAGASKWQQFWLITMPLSLQSISVAVVLWIIAGMKTFEMVIALVGAQGSPPVQARTAAVQQYLATGGEGTPRLGQAAAIGIVIFILTTLFIILARRGFGRERVELA